MPTYKLKIHDKRYDKAPDFTDLPNIQIVSQMDLCVICGRDIPIGTMVCVTCLKNEIDALDSLRFIPIPIELVKPKTKGDNRHGRKG